MQDPLTAAYLEILRQRVLEPEGGFAGHAGGGYRADATAWAAVALEAVGQRSDWLTLARGCLAAQQLADGRVSLSPQHPDAVWPTPLAVLAWHQARDYREATDKAARFMLATTGRHWPRNPSLAYEHDPSLKGWPWISATHSWVEPTAMAVMALRISGCGEHERVKEGIRLLLDRQLPGGGWNYGNTKVFGQELFPFPESTGVALNALRGAASPAQVRKSLDYLHSRLKEVRTPLALSWGLMGLAAWGEGPAAAGAWTKECLDRQARYGAYDTVSLSLLMAASRAPQGLESVFAVRGKS
ncbi:MAG: hypothetical protein C4567_16450 [Deltaproteobacteria bacterium]|nr:MAG: hypothetical protein C4567_16450 [Deltaproteobacteria bacterium]